MILLLDRSDVRIGPIHFYVPFDSIFEIWENVNFLSPCRFFIRYLLMIYLNNDLLNGLTELGNPIKINKNFKP